MAPRDEGKRRPRTIAAVGVLVVEAGLAVLGVLVHYGFTAEYGDITDPAVEDWRSRLSLGAGGIGGVALGLVVVAALIAVLLSAQPWVRLAAVTIPILMVGGCSP